MTTFENALFGAQKFFPNLTIKYKDQSLFMKIIGYLLFFNKDFMNYDTSIGNTIYLPSENYIKLHPISSVMVLLHELVHMYDERKYSKPLFMILYIFPQILSILFIPFIFVIGIKYSLLFLIFLLPVPSYLRYYFERRAYTISYYVSFKLNMIKNIGIDLNIQKNFYIEQFKLSNYYFMWPFSGVDAYFDQVSQEIIKNNKPDLEPELYNIVDNILGNL